MGPDTNDGASGCEALLPDAPSEAHQTSLEPWIKAARRWRYKMLKANTAVRPNHTNPAKYAQRKAAS